MQLNTPLLKRDIGSDDDGKSRQQWQCAALSCLVPSALAVVFVVAVVKLCKLPKMTKFTCDTITGQYIELMSGKLYIRELVRLLG